MTDAATIGVLAAFAAGIVSFLSPCVLPLVPAYVSYVAGESYQRRRHLHAEERLAALGMSALFVAGFSTVFIAFGASASAIGQLFLRYRYEANLVAGVIVIVFGLFMLGLWRWVPWLLRDLRLHPRLHGGNPVAAFLLALAARCRPRAGPVGMKPRKESAARKHKRMWFDMGNLITNPQEQFMNTRRSFVLAASAVLALGMVPGARAQQALPLVTVYKSPTCGCCGEWMKHMQASGFRVETHETADVTPIRRRYGVPDELSSCHTAIVAGYAIEGHVPAADIKRLLHERTKAKGLAVPGMVAGSPGMEQGPPQPYATIVFDERGSKVFERH